MYLINAKDLPTVVRLINRLPDGYLNKGNMYDGFYEVLSESELEKIWSVGIFEEV